MGVCRDLAEDLGLHVFDIAKPAHDLDTFMDPEGYSLVDASDLEWGKT
ncbi:MAG: hypothetical protein AAF889_04510 [Cyanobacteria bacterium P01_D01_bin.73]